MMMNNESCSTLPLNYKQLSKQVIFSLSWAYFKNCNLANMVVN